MYSGAWRVVALALSLLGSTLHAADHPLGGDLLRLRGSRGGRPFEFRAARDPGIFPVPGMDPSLQGATLDVIGTGPGDGSSGSVGLPAALWRVVGTPPGSLGFRYLDRAARDGVRKVILRFGTTGGTLVVLGYGRGWPYRLAQPQETIDVRLRVGTERYCASFARFIQNRPGLVLARHALAPIACPGDGPAARCGDGVLEAPEECDDGNSADGDGCSGLCLLESLACGNGTLDGGEECDDGARRPGDGCDGACQLESPAGACAGVPGVSGTALDTVLVAEGLEAPIHIAAAPLDPRRLFVVEQAGRVRVIRDGVLLDDPFLDVTSRVLCCGERGLLSIAFHPDYERNRRFFVAYTDRTGDVVVARYEGAGDDADETSESILLAVPHRTYGNHNGGQLAFGPDGYLYVSAGDGGSGDDPLESGQDGSTWRGKILRLDVDVDGPPYYSVPPTNPFVGSGDPLDEIWALGLRNPWRLSFDRATGDLYTGDVGQGAWEEIDVQPAASAGGENYGWDIFEGNQCHEPEPPATECPAPPLGFTMPVLEYSHGEGCSVTGGFVYRGCALPDLRGTYFYSDFCSAFVRTFRLSAGVPVDHADRTQDLAPGEGRSLGNPTSFGEDARGELYVADYDGEVFRIVPQLPSPASASAR